MNARSHSRFGLLSGAGWRLATWAMESAHSLRLCLPRGGSRLREQLPPIAKRVGYYANAGNCPRAITSMSSPLRKASRDECVGAKSRKDLLPKEPLLFHLVVRRLSVFTIEQLAKKPYDCVKLFDSQHLILRYDNRANTNLMKNYLASSVLACGQFVEVITAVELQSNVISPGQIEIIPGFTSTSAQLIVESDLPVKLWQGYLVAAHFRGEREKDSRVGFHGGPRVADNPPDGLRGLCLTGAFWRALHILAKKQGCCHRVLGLHEAARILFVHDVTPAEFIAELNELDN